MKTILALSAVSALALFTLNAQAATTAKQECGAVPAAQWMTKDALTKKITAMGYKIASLKPDNGCYEMKGTDAKGAHVDLKFHPDSGEPVVKASN